MGDHCVDTTLYYRRRICVVAAAQRWAVLACACFVVSQAAPVPEEGLRLGEAVLEEVTTPSSTSTLNSEDSEEDFKSLWHRTPLEIFLAWLYGIFIIVAVGGLAAVVAAKLGFFDDVEQD